jgi:hypothetical protein
MLLADTVNRTESGVVFARSIASRPSHATRRRSRHGARLERNTADRSDAAALISLPRKAQHTHWLQAFLIVHAVSGSDVRLFAFGRYQLPASGALRMFTKAVGLRSSGPAAELSVGAR